MQFIFPTFLIATAVLAIPVIIHLFYFRKFKKVYFTNVRFLKELKEETSSRSKLRNLLVLLMRLLAFLFLVLAFAQPFLPSGKEADERNRAVAIYLDNSFSMMGTVQDVPLLDRVKQKAYDVVDGFSEADRYLLITNDMLARHQRWVDKNTILGFIEEVELSPSVRQLSVVADRINQMGIQLSDNKLVAFLLSDFQHQITDLEETYDYDLTLIPMGNVRENNISIDSCWFQSPILLKGQTAQLLVKVSNYSNDKVENIRVSLSYAGEQKPVGSVTIPANASVVDTISILINEGGWQEMMLEIADYPIQFDDRYYLAIEVPDQMKVLALYQQSPNRYIQAAYDAIPEFGLTQQSVNNVDYAALVQNRLILLHGINNISSGLAAQLKTATDAGSNILLFPAANADLNAMNSFLRLLGVNAMGDYETGDFLSSSINSNAFIFKDVFEHIPDNLKLPDTKGRYRLPAGTAESLIKFRDGRNMLEVHPVGNGFLFISAAPLDREISSFITNAEVLMPLLYRSVLQATSGKKVAYIIGQDEQVEIELPEVRGDVTYNMIGPDNFLPGVSSIGNRAVLTLFNQINKAGQYHLKNREGESVAVLAFNYDRTESDPSKYSTADLKNKYPELTVVDQIAAANLSDFIAVKDRGTFLWRICLFLALFFLLAEVCILRFWKV